MEALILNTLEFNIIISTSLYFLNYYRSLKSFSLYAYQIARYYLDLSLLDYSCLEFSPSLIAASSLYLATTIISNKKTWIPASSLLKK